MASKRNTGNLRSAQHPAPLQGAIISAVVSGGYHPRLCSNRPPALNIQMHPRKPRIPTRRPSASLGSAELVEVQDAWVGLNRARGCRSCLTQAAGTWLTSRWLAGRGPLALKGSVRRDGGHSLPLRVGDLGMLLILYHHVVSILLAQITL